VDEKVGEFGGFTHFHRAAEKGFLRSLKAHIEKGWDVNIKDDRGMTALHYAAGEGQYDAVLELLAARALADARGARGWSPLHMAAALGHVQVAAALLDHRADPGVVDDSGLTPLHHAAGEGSTRVARLLISQGAPLHARDRMEWTPLHHAAYEGHEETMDALLAAGADASARNRAGRTPAEQAALRAHLPRGGIHARTSEPLVAGAMSARPAQSRPNIVVVVVDALRPDRLGCYGYERNTSPSLDSLAREGVLFTDAMAHGPSTIVSTPALLTGRRAGEHKMEWVRWDDVRQYARPAGSHPTLAEVLQQHGYHTAAISANPVLEDRIGLDRGFDLFDVSCAQRSIWHVTSAPDVNRLAREWLERDGHAQGPFFLYLHYVEPHILYCPPSEFCVFGRPGYTARDAQRNIEIDLLPDSTPDHVVTEAILSAHGLSRGDVERLSDLYDDEVLCSDFYVNYLFDQLKQLGAYENTLIVVTADHGEAFLEHDTIKHCETLYQELIRVPLIIAGPGVQRGREINALVELVDVAPTIIEAAGIELTTPLSGGSLYQAISQGEPIGENVGIAYLPSKQMCAFRSGPMKLIVSPDRSELYDLSADPYESKNLAASRPGEVARLRAKLEEMMRRQPSVVERSEDPSPAQLNALKAMGYLR
jgi:arylsulfatase